MPDRRRYVVFRWEPLEAAGGRADEMARYDRLETAVAAARLAIGGKAAWDILDLTTGQWVANSVDDER